MRIKHLLLAVTFFCSLFFLSDCNTPLLTGLTPFNSIAGTWESPISGDLYGLHTDDVGRQCLVKTKVKIDIRTSGSRTGEDLSNGKFEADIYLTFESCENIAVNGCHLMYYPSFSYTIIGKQSSNLLETISGTDGASMTVNSDHTSVTSSTMMFRFKEWAHDLSTDGGYIILQKKN